MGNFIYIHLFISMIFSILFSVLGNEKAILVPLNYTSIMEARKRFMSIDSSSLPDPPMPSYSFNLYHRDVFDKSNFKDYDSMLRSRVARGHTRASRLASVLENDRLNDGVLSMGSTTVYDADGEYVASFMVGSERTRMYLQVDTGTDVVWWQCGPCVQCYKQIYDPIYDSTKSKTFQNIDCHKQNGTCIVEDPSFECNPQMPYCRYSVLYGSGAVSVGMMASEVITFELDYISLRILFGCGKNQKGGKVQFSGSYSGVVGLGRRVNAKLPGAYSLTSQFNASVFSLCLPNFDSGKSSTLSFHKAPWPKATMAKLVPNYMYPQLHFVNLYKIFINDREIPVKPSWWQFSGRKMTGGVVVDTGTTITHFPHDFYVVFRYIFRSEVGRIKVVDDPVGDFDTCYLADQEGGMEYFPAVKLYFGGMNRRSMLFLAQDRVVTLIGNQYCLAFKAWDKDLTILGAHQLQGVGLTFDTSKNTLSFDLDACD